MVQLEKVYTKEDPKFSPPYGDGTIPGAIDAQVKAFSPPYGDGTDAAARKSSLLVFSPPYGDGAIQAKPNVPHC